MKTTFLVSVLLVSFFSNAQSEQLPSMFWNNYSQFNPAVSGMEYQHKGILTHRNEWPSLSGNRRTLFANYDGRIGRRHGVGLNLVSSRRYWETQHQEIQANYSYHHAMNNSRRISIGISPSYNRSAVSEVWGPSVTKTNSLIFNTGIAYQGSTILAGVGVTQLFNIESSEGGGESNLKPNFFAHFRKIFQIGRKLEVYLDGVYQTVDGFHSAKLNARIVLYDKFMFGGGIGARDNFMAQIGWDIANRFRVAYAYDTSVNKLSNGASGGSHEFTLGYVIKYRVRNLAFRTISTPNF